MRSSDTSTFRHSVLDSVLDSALDSAFEYLAYRDSALEYLAYRDLAYRDLALFPALGEFESSTHLGDSRCHLHQ
ncbi:hypothetical protein [Leptothoe sp. PORK10 BA2]|uniref:hypothetical protein n=1 Tax=Leptothoe sp. PORK10 BA2 TaxID=3110254 RepID=UPI002B218B98|nr:hypothetical protein [Leptothoe sp. PORK10 BA2]MEA5463927.1 hypothetical protein [Leptothoe sp. PORK10 BA2]